MKFKDLRTEVVLYRLRIGHVGVVSYMNKFCMYDNKICQICKLPETVHHYLLVCHKFAEQRRVMIRKLHNMDIYGHYLIHLAKK